MTFWVWLLPLASDQTWEVNSAPERSCLSRKVCSSATVGSLRPSCRQEASALGNAAGPRLMVSMQAPSWNIVSAGQGLLAWNSEESLPSRRSASAALVALAAESARSACEESETLAPCA